MTIYTYDDLGNILTTGCENDTSSYIYDATGRILLVNENGDCTRIIYDDLGRVVQEISSEDYDSEKDGLPDENTYSDSSAGHTYVYNETTGNLDSETNCNGLTTAYTYYSTGEMETESFDIYEFEYSISANLVKIYVNGINALSYNYDENNYLTSEVYANGDVIRYEYDDDNNLVRQYHNDETSAYVTYSYDEDNELTQKVNADTGLKYVYGEDNEVSVYNISDGTLVQSYTETVTGADEDNDIEAQTDVTETHFGTTYSSVIKDSSISYTTDSNTIEYSYQSDDDGNITSDCVTNGESTAVSSTYTYDDNGNNIIKKCTYKYENVQYSDEFTNQYDAENRITAFGINGLDGFYTYDENDQIVKVNNGLGDAYISTYTYDSRGNVTSKNIYSHRVSGDITTPPLETTTFTYSDDGWNDLLVAVNDDELTYDANGNVLTYGDKEFTWNTGRNLESITDGDNEYSYTYDENGIRTSKTVNGTTTYYNTKDGVILSQTDGTNTMYFQYDTSGIPLGFIYNGTQYLYMTNQMGDVIALTDEVGNVFVEYNYDEWGNLLGIYTVNDSDEEIEIANANPIRYHGYYYDNETGYYYLQSRYYDPSICRFINADVAIYAKSQKDEFSGVNIFVYCCNDAINNIDIFGYSKYSYYVTVYYYKSKLKNTNQFGHMDIKVDNTIYSYANYSSGNLLVTTNITDYHLSQKNKYTIKSYKIKLTKGELIDIRGYINRIKKTLKTNTTSFDSSGKSKIYKITSGNYKTYKLTSVNCSTFVLDILREVFSLKIILYRIVQAIAYLNTELDTPARISQICEWLSNSR